MTGIRTRAGGVSLMCRTAGVSYSRAVVIYAGGAAFNLLSAVVSSSDSAFYAYSIGAAVFNLFPLPASDGTELLYALLCAFGCSPDVAYRAVRFMSDVMLLFLWCGVVYLNLTGQGELLPLIFIVGVIIYRLGETR